MRSLEAIVPQPYYISGAVDRAVVVEVPRGRTGHTLTVVADPDEVIGAVDLTVPIGISRFGSSGSRCLGGSRCRGGGRAIDGTGGFDGGYQIVDVIQVTDCKCRSIQIRL